MPDPHKPLPPDDREPEDPRSRHEPPPPPDEPREDRLPPARVAPVEPFRTGRSLPTATRTIRNGEIQGHEREMPADRDSK
jgi:hypothetical protein